MANLTQPLREEHKELLPHIEAIRHAADAIGEMPLSELRPQLSMMSTTSSRIICCRTPGRGSRALSRRRQSDGRARSDWHHEPRSR